LSGLVDPATFRCSDFWRLRAKSIFYSKSPKCRTAAIAALPENQANFSRALVFLGPTFVIGTP
jgi:hypothetical protein